MFSLPILSQVIWAFVYIGVLKYGRRHILKQYTRCRFFDIKKTYKIELKVKQSFYLEKCKDWNAIVTLGGG